MLSSDITLESVEECVYMQDCHQWSSISWEAHDRNLKEKYEYLSLKSPWQQPSGCSQRLKTA